MIETRKRFLQVVIAAFFIYALTLAHDITITSLSLTANVAGWDWLPMAAHPVAWLLTLPLRILPAAWIPFALNFFSAMLAALTLGILARSVELFPWDCPPDAKKIWSLRLPALLACAICGFEFSFWQEATAASGEMLDIFLFAAAIWCLLEFRVARKMRWLESAAILWGIGMAENWVMLLTLPFFVAGIVWLRGLEFFQKKFLIRMALLGLAGFSIFFLQPLANSLNPHSPWTFGGAWLVSFRNFKSIFHSLYFDFWSWHRLATVAVLLYFLVPMISCLVRMKHEAAPNLPELERYQIWFFRALRIALLLAALWLALDPQTGPRQIIRKQIGELQPLLVFDYLNALSAAFLAGSLLYAAQIPPQRRARSAIEKFNSFLRRAAPGLLTLFLMVTVAALAARSLPAIFLANAQSLQSYGELTARSLPDSGGIIFGDNAEKLEVLQAALAHHSSKNGWQIADLRFLSAPKYRANLERKFGGNWLAPQTAHELKEGETIVLIDHLAQSNRIFFLQPGAGSPLFEAFYPQALPAIRELKRYEPKSFSGAPLTPEEISAGEKFWDDAWQNQLQYISRVASGETASWLKMFPHRLGLTPIAPLQSQVLGLWFSAAVNDWGVALQRAGKIPEAHKRFEEALALSTNNFSAAVNLRVCGELLAGKKVETDPAQFNEKFRNFSQLAQFISVGGTFDEPFICEVLGNAWFTTGCPRQAWQQFDRAHTLAPDAVTPQLALAEIYSRLRMDDKVFEAVRNLRALLANSTAANTNALDLELSMLEAHSWMSQTNFARANAIFESVLQNHPDDPQVAELLFKVYLTAGEVTNALQLIEQQLQKNPDNLAALNNQAALLIQLHRANEALPVLDRALAITNLPSIQLNRAIANLALKNYSAAQSDYTQVENANVDKFTVQFGLAQIALSRGDTNDAAQRLEMCLSNAPLQSAKWTQARAQLDLLQKKMAR